LERYQAQLAEQSRRDNENSCEMGWREYERNEEKEKEEKRKREELAEERREEVRRAV